METTTLKLEEQKRVEFIQRVFRGEVTIATTAPAKKILAAGVLFRVSFEGPLAGLCTEGIGLAIKE